MTQSLITAGDASNGLVSSAGNDGTLVLQTGAAGAKVSALILAADGTPTLLKQPVVPAQSMIRLSNANAYGSSSTCIKRFGTTVTSQGTDITYSDSATLGGSFTINSSGVYAITTADNGALPTWAGISVNTTQPSTAIQSLTNTSECLTAAYGGVAGGNASCSWTGYLASGSVVRAHTAGAATSGPAISFFTITRVA